MCFIWLPVVITPGRGIGRESANTTERNVNKTLNHYLVPEHFSVSPADGFSLPTVIVQK